MNIIILAHPKFSQSQSMPRYAEFLFKGMVRRGHNVEIWSPNAVFSRFISSGSFNKWLGYIDQYILFPITIKLRASRTSSDTLFVFSDHSLGPWVPYLSERLHVIHCHDFLAQNSAIKGITENKLNWSGKVYQRYIRNGFSKGKNFISISNKTQQDLHDILPFTPISSVVIYNSLTRPFKREINISMLRKELSTVIGQNLDDGFLLHIGNNQWYKNRIGVIEIYNAWRSVSERAHPLIMLGANPPESLIETKAKSEYSEDIHFISGASDDLVSKFYQSCSIFIFPSLAEGFGWPIIEAMASGAIVLTTNEAPMTEVGGDAAIYIPKKPSIDTESVSKWANQCAVSLEKIICLDQQSKENLIDKSLLNAQRFDMEETLDTIELTYLHITRNNTDG